MAKEVKVKVLIVGVVTALLVVGQTTGGGVSPKVGGPEDLTVEDRDRVRQLQTQAWKTVAEIRQARIEGLEAQDRLDGINQQLGELIRQLATTYKAQGYILNEQFGWDKPRPPMLPQSVPEPAPELADGDGPAGNEEGEK